MTFLLRVDNYIQFSTTYDPENSNYQLVFSFNKKLDNTLKLTYRPWCCFWVGENKYRQDVLDVVSLMDEVDYIPVMTKNDVLICFQEFNKIFDILGYEKLQDLSEHYDKARYYCDILNLLCEEYGESELERAIEYKELSNSDLDFLDRFYKLPNDIKKSDWLGNNIDSALFNRIYNFLPRKFVEELKVFGSNRTVTSSRPLEELEFNISSKLYPDPKPLSEIFYKEFKLWEDLTGEEIRDRIRDLYIKNGITKCPLIQDIFEFFEVTPTRSRISGKRGYKLMLRKYEN